MTIFLIKLELEKFLNIDFGVFIPFTSTLVTTMILTRLKFLSACGLLRLWLIDQIHTLTHFMNNSSFLLGTYCNEVINVPLVLLSCIRMFKLTKLCEKLISNMMTKKSLSYGKFELNQLRSYIHCHGPNPKAVAE